VITTAQDRRGQRGRPAGLIIAAALCVVALHGCGDRAPPAAAPVGPQAVDAALLSAERYFSSNDLASAEAVLGRLIERAPETYRAHELLGQVLYRRAIEMQTAGDAAAAAESLQQAYEHYRLAVAHAGEDDPMLAAGLNQSAGEFASAAGRRDEAIVHFRAAGTLDPLNPKSPLYESQMLLAAERYGEAEVALRRSLMLDPDEAYAHASLATVAHAAGQCARAIGHIEEARAIDPEALALRIQEARIRRHCDGPRAALQLLVSLPDATRAEAIVAEEIAVCWNELDEPGRAAEAWEHRLRRHPHDWRAAIAAANAWLDAGESGKGWALWQQARAIAPNAPEVMALELKRRPKEP
jgi:tetratricopeptide (TPR) repeat protein